MSSRARLPEIVKTLSELINPPIIKVTFPGRRVTIAPESEGFMVSTRNGEEEKQSLKREELEDFLLEISKELPIAIELGFPTSEALQMSNPTTSQWLQEKILDFSVPRLRDKMGRVLVAKKVNNKIFVDPIEDAEAEWEPAPDILYVPIYEKVRPTYYTYMLSRLEKLVKEQREEYFLRFLDGKKASIVVPWSTVTWYLTSAKHNTSTEQRNSNLLSYLANAPQKVKPTKAEAEIILRALTRIPFVGKDPSNLDRCDDILSVLGRFQTFRSSTYEKVLERWTNECKQAIEFKELVPDEEIDSYLADLAAFIGRAHKETCPFLQEHKRDVNTQIDLLDSLTTRSLTSDQRRKILSLQQELGRLRQNLAEKISERC